MVITENSPLFFPETYQFEEFPLNKVAGVIKAVFVGSYKDRFHNLYCCFVCMENGRRFKTHTLWGNQHMPAEAGPCFSKVPPGSQWSLTMQKSASGYPIFKRADEIIDTEKISA